MRVNVGPHQKLWARLRDKWVRFEHVFEDDPDWAVVWSFESSEWTNVELKDLEFPNGILALFTDSENHAHFHIYLDGHLFACHKASGLNDEFNPEDVSMGLAIVSCARNGFGEFNCAYTRSFTDCSEAYIKET